MKSRISSYLCSNITWQESLTSKWRDWIKVYTKNIHISSNTARQTCMSLTTCFWKYTVMKTFPVTVLNFGVCGISLVRGLIKINNKSCTVYKSGNYYNRLLIDMLIAKNSGLVFLDTVYTFSFIILVQTRLRRNSAIVEPRGNVKISQQLNHL